MHVACWYNQPELLKELISELEPADRQAMQDAADAVGLTQNGETPLLLARAEGADGCIAVLSAPSNLMTSSRDASHRQEQIELARQDSTEPQRPKESYR